MNTWLPTLLTVCAAAFFQAVGVAFLYGTLWQKVKSQSSDIEALKLNDIRQDAGILALIVGRYPHGAEEPRQTQQT
jgi:hypothetical protein